MERHALWLLLLLAGGCSSVPKTVRISETHQDGDAVWWTEIVSENETVGSGNARNPGLGTSDRAKETTYWVLCYRNRVPLCVRMEPVTVQRANAEEFLHRWPGTVSPTPMRIVPDAGQQ